MSINFDSLEQKIDQVLALCQRLEAENRQLQARVDALESEKKHLVERMETARIKLETMMANLPENT